MEHVLTILTIFRSVAAMTYVAWPSVKPEQNVLKMALRKCALLPMFKSLEWAVNAIIGLKTNICFVFVIVTWRSCISGHFIPVPINISS